MSFYTKISILKEDFGKYLIYLSGKIVPGIVSLFIIPLIIKNFGSVTYGLYSTIYGTFLLVISFSSGWLSQGIIRFYYDIKDKENFYWGIKAKSLLISAIISPIIILVGYYFDIGVLATVCLLLASYVSLLFTFQGAILQSRKKAFLISLSDSSRAVINYLTIYCFIWITIDRNIWTLFFATLISFVIGYVISVKGKISFFFFGVKTKFMDISMSSFIDIWRFGWPLSLWLISAGLLNIGDRYVIIFFLDQEKLANYSAVYDVTYKFYTFLFSPLVMVLYPTLVNAFNNRDNKKVKTLWFVAILFEIFIFLLTLILMLKFEQLIFNDLIGLSLNEDAKSLIFPISAGAFLWQLSIVIHKLLELNGLTKHMLKYVLIAFVFNMVANVIFIPIYGVLAAAYTTLLSSIIYLILVLVKSIKISK